MKNKFEKIELLNFEGPVLVATLVPNKGFVITDEDKLIVDFLTTEGLKQFIFNQKIIVDSRGRKWDYSKESESAKPNKNDLVSFLQKQI